MTTFQTPIRKALAVPTVSDSTSDARSLQPTICIVDDDEGMRKSLSWLVRTLGVPVKAFPSAETFLNEYDGQSAGCLVVDIRMAGMGGLDLQRELRRRGDEIPVIVLTGYGTVPVAVEALKQGAAAFLQKPVDDDVLLETIGRALAFDARRRSESQEHCVARERISRLTAREREVLRHVVGGLASKEIAARLSVSAKTIEVHRANIMRKMEVESVAQLVRTAVLAGMMLDAVEP